MIQKITKGVAGGKTSIKLKASDIYSDDSGSESEDKRSGKLSSSSSRSSSDDSEEENSSKGVIGNVSNKSSIRII